MSQNESLKPVSLQPTPASVTRGYRPPGVSRDGTGMSGSGGIGMTGVSSGMGMGSGSGGSSGMGMGSGSGGMGMGSGSGGMGMGSRSGGTGMNVSGDMGMSGVSGGMGMGSEGGGMGMSGVSGGTGMGSGSMGMGYDSGPSGWSSGIKTQPMNPIQTGSTPLNPLQTQSGVGGGGIFGGLEIRNTVSSGQSHMTGGANLIGQQTHQMMSGQSHMTGTGNLIGAPTQPSNTPLIPAQAESKPPSGWSSSIEQSKTAQNTGGVNPQMGWSGSIAGTAQSSNWMAQNQSSNQFSMGSQSMSAPLQPTVAQSSNWTGQASNWASQNPGTNPAPTAASLMMGGPLLPQGNPSIPAQQPPNTLDNPFADLSFLG